MTRYRRELLELLRAAQINPEELTAARVRDLLGFPDELPDLASLRPPGGIIDRKGFRSAT
jgi:hypothetical protein